MRVGLITDTHIPDIEEELPSQVFDVFRGGDLILHAGDIYNMSVLDELERIAPVKAAMGDDDSFTLLGDRRVERSMCWTWRDTLCGSFMRGSDCRWRSVRRFRQPHLS
jgi:putative phosphoesterase